MGTSVKSSLMQLWNLLCLNIFFTRRMMCLSIHDGFIVYDHRGIDFFSISEMLFPKMKFMLQLISSRPCFYMKSNNHNVGLVSVDCSLHTPFIALEDGQYKKRTDILANTHVEYNFSGTLPTTFIIPARKSQFIQEKNFKPCSSSLVCHCNEYKHCLQGIVHWKTILVPTIWSETNKKNQRISANRRLWCCW